MDNLVLSFVYAARSIRRGGQWTTLAIFCIAAGVATVVALRGLGLAINDSLVENVRINNRGDITLIKSGPGGVFSFGVQFAEDRVFSADELDALDEWTTERGAISSGYRLGGSMQVSPVDDPRPQDEQRPLPISPYIIDPATYPPTHTITAVEPAGVPLSELFAQPDAVVISDNLADQLGLAVGDEMRISRRDEPMIVTGIVGAENEAGLRNIFGAFFGFVYLDINTVEADERGPTAYAIAFPQPLDAAATDAALETLLPLADESGPVQADTAVSLLERNQAIAQVIGDFIVVMGLGALLIGGVGIMNTMLVLVRRRTSEIAALKTFGLKSWQIGRLFLAEGLLFGLIGSVAGLLLGVLLGGIVNQFGETFIQQPLSWRVHPEALLYGFVLGMVVTSVFSVAPIMLAVQVRPAIILRPNEAYAPRLGIVRALAWLLLVVVAIGLMVGQILAPSFELANNPPTIPASSTMMNPEGAQTLQEEETGADLPSSYLVGMAGVAGTLLIIGLLIGLLWCVVWLVGRLPAFGSVDLQLALRNLSVARWRTAATLLALGAGMFTLSSIIFVGQGTRELLNIQLENQIGGNVMAFPLAPGRLAGIGEGAMDEALANVEGVQYRTRLLGYDTELTMINGQPVARPDDDERRFFELTPEERAVFFWDRATVWDSDNPAIYERYTMAAGRRLTPEDRGARVLIGSQEQAALLGIEVGSVVSYQIGNQRLNFEVVGLIADTGALSGGGDTVIVPPGNLDRNPSDFTLYTYQIEDSQVNAALVALTAIQFPPTFALDVHFVDSLVSRIIDQFAAIPTVVALLSLLAAAVIMANTVALSTLEQRRQIGVLKAIGLKGRRVLRIMLIESSLVGLLSALLGIGLSLIFVEVYGDLSETPIPFPANATLGAIGLVIASVLIGWLSTFLSANVALHERVMNVLRYE